MSATTTASSRISAEHARTISRATNLTVVMLALAAAALSYDGLYRLAHDAGVAAGLAPLLPVVVDGLVVVGSLSTVYAALAVLPSRWPWTLVVFGVLASVTGNVLAARPGVIPGLVAGAPPIVLAAALETALRLARHRATLGPAQSRRKRRTAPAADRLENAAPTSSSSEVSSSSPQSPRRTDRTASTQRSAAPTSTRARVAAMLAADPGTTAGAIARELGIDPSTIRKHVRALRDAEADEQRAQLHAIGA